MTCVKKITDDLLFNCDDPPKKGIEGGKAVLINFDDIDKSASVSNGSIISVITLKAGAVAYTVEWYKDLASGNSAFAPSTEDIDGFLHNFLTRLATSSAESAERANELKNGRFVLVYESKFKGVGWDDAFKVAGWENGLKLSEMIYNTAENSGAPLFTLTTEEGDVEKYPYSIFLETDYATSKARFNTLFDALIDIPSGEEALFYLDGNANGDKLVDRSGNGRNFAITDKDFTSNYFPYKSGALISAPAGDSILIAADVNNFLYDSGGVPNLIPVVSFFQNIDYNDKFFNRHVAKVINGNGVETTEPHVKDIVLYDDALTGADLTEAVAYYAVPTNTADLIVGPEVGDDYTTISAAVTAALAGQTIYVKTGVYAEQVSLAKEIYVIAIGGAVIKSSTAQSVYITGGTGAYIKGFDLDGADGTDMVVYIHNAAPSTTVERCFIHNATGARGLYQREGTTTTTIKDCIFVTNTDIVSLETRTQSSIIGCYFGGTSNASAVLGVGSFTFDLSVTYSKFAHSTVQVYSIIVNNNAANVDINYNGFDLVEVVRIVSNSATYSNKYSFNYNIVTVETSGSVVNLPDANCDIIGNVMYLASGKGVFQYIGISTGIFNIKDNLAVMDSQPVNGTLIQIGGAAELTISGNSLACKNVVTGEGNGIYLGVENTEQSTPVLVEKNKVYGPEHYGAQVDVGNFHSGIFLWEYKNAIVRFNYVTGFKTVGTIIIKGTACVNISTAVYGNISIAGHVIIKGMIGVFCHNNTMDNGWCIDIVNGDLDEDSSGTVAKNNLLIGSSNELGTSQVELNNVESEVNLDFDYNMFYSASGLFAASREVAGNLTFAQWQAFGQDANGDELTAGEFANLFNNVAARDYSLEIGAVAIGAGVDLGATFEDGLDESTVWGDDETLPSVVTKQRTASWDVGAFVS